jgi:hypothetical protein
MFVLIANGRPRPLSEGRLRYLGMCTAYQTLCDEWWRTCGFAEKFQEARMLEHLHTCPTCMPIAVANRME